MNRRIWHETYRSMRLEAKRHPRSEFPVIVAFPYNGGSFAAVLKDGELTIASRILRDRPPSNRIATELRWARQYRLNAVRWRGYPPQERLEKAAARACIAACFPLRPVSAFQLIP